MTFDAGSIEARLILNRQQFQDDLAAAQAEGDDFDGSVFEAKAEVNIDQVTAAFAKIQTEWTAVKAALDSGADLSVGDGEALAAISATEAAYQALKASLSQTLTVQAATDTTGITNANEPPPIQQQVTIDPAEAMAALAEIQAAYNALVASIQKDATLDVNTMPFNIAILNARIALNDLQTALADKNSLNVSDAAALAAIAETEAAFLVLKESLAGGISTGAVSVTGVAAATAAETALAGAITATGTAANTTHPSLAGLAAVTAASIPLWNAGTGAFGAWGGSVNLFGGALKSVGIPAIIASAGAVHILVDSIIEIAGTLIPATVAMVAFGVTAAPTVQHIAVQMKNLWTTTQALNQSIYPITTAMQQLGNAVKPEVYTLFGEALYEVNANAKTFSGIAAQAGTVLDQLGARFVAATTFGTGFSQFTAHAASDLQGWGTLIGNVGGIIGNILKVLPGYAEDILVALDNVTHAIEVVTGSGIGQWFLEVGLAAHGAILWLGLAATAAVYLGNGLVTLAAKFGLAEAGALSFDAAQFGTGVLLMASYIGDLGVALVTLSGTEDVATAATGVFEGALIALDAVNPLVWIGAAVAGIGLLIYWMTRSTSATNDYNVAVNKALQTEPVNQLGISLAQQMTSTTDLLTAAQTKLSTIQQYQTVTGPQHAASVKQVTSAYSDQEAVIQGYQGELGTLSTYQNNYNMLLKAAGGSVALLGQAQITTNQILGAGTNTTGHLTEAMKEMLVEVAAQQNAWQAMQLGVGRAGAAMNALNYTGDTTANMLGSLDVDMANITKAQDALTGVLLGGEQTFYTYATNLGTIHTNAAVAGASLSGLNTQSLALGSTYYSTVLPSAQKMVDALEMQLIPTNKLIPVVGTLGSQMLGYAGSNTAARAAIVSFINDALGPGTVSLQTLNKWVGQNTTTMSGLKSIVDQTELSASKLGQTLQGDVNQVMANSIVMALGASKAFDAFSSSVIGGTTSGVQFEAQGQKVLTVLEKEYGTDLPAAKKAFVDYAINGLGLSTSQANTLWATLTRQQLDTMASKAKTSEAAFINLATGGLGLSTTKAEALWTTLREQYLDTVAAKSDLTKTAFLNLATQLGLTTTQANNNWTALHKIASGSPYDANLKETGTGTFSISQIAGAGGIAVPIPAGVAAAAGAYITNGTTSTADDQLARVSKGELIVPTALEPLVRPILSGKIPGYAAGGLVSSTGGAIGSLTPAANNAAFDNAVTKTMEAAMTAALRAAEIAAMSGSGIVRFAESFIGKIPYVWGGTTLGPAGADCSGFTQSVYGHYGISAPRTSEAQGGWVKRGAPTPGGLAFYHSPAGGADPGHVAIVASGSQVVSQGGGMGPQMMGINDMPLLWTGIPPGGFPASATSGGGSSAPSASGNMSPSAIESLWTQMGGPAGAAANMAAIAAAESGDNPTAVQQGEPPGLTGYGLYQITPTSGISQNGAYGNLLNAANNTRAAISLYDSSGYGPWTSDPVGSSLVASGITYDSGGVLPAGAFGFNGTGAPETILSPSDSQSLKLLATQGASSTQPTPAANDRLDQICALLSKLIDTTAAVPKGVGAHVGSSLNSASHDASFRNRYPRGGT